MVHSVINILFILLVTVNSTTCNKNYKPITVAATEVRHYNSMMGEQFYRTFTFESIIVFQMQIHLLNFEDRYKLILSIMN